MFIVETTQRTASSNELFDSSQYQDCIIAQSNQPDTLGMPYFDAMFDLNGQIHGITMLKIRQQPPFPMQYIDAMFVELIRANDKYSSKKTWDHWRIP